MNRNPRMVVVLLMLALLPVRALAAVTIGFCAFAHEHGTTAAQGLHDHDPRDHDSHGPQAPAHSHDTSPCSSCVEHCSSGFFVPSAVPITLCALPSAQRHALQERCAAGFVPDHLDPPPLVL